MTYKEMYYYQLDIIVDFINCLNYLFLYFQFVYIKKNCVCVIFISSNVYSFLCFISDLVRLSSLSWRK